MWLDHILTESFVKPPVSLRGGCTTDVFDYKTGVQLPYSGGYMVIAFKGTKQQMLNQVQHDMEGI